MTTDISSFPVWRTGLLLTAVAAGIAGPGVARAAQRAPVAPAPLVTRDCQEEQAFVDGDGAAVSQALPVGYRPLVDPTSGAPIVFARGIRCRAVTVHGRTAPVTMASIGVTVQTPDGTGCSSAAPTDAIGRGDVPPVCNWYPLAWLASSRQVAGWLRAGSPDLRVIYAPGIRFTLGTAGPPRFGAPFRLDVPTSTGVPFAMTASTWQRPGALDIRGGYWHGAGSRALKIVFAGELTSGDAEGSVLAPPDSFVARLLGADHRPYLPAFSAVGAEHWDYAVYREQHPHQAGAHRFTGTCSLRGTSEFAPAANNTPKVLHYRYHSTGTCTGTLDGRSVSDTAVSWNQHGVSYGTCSSARTTAPGVGTVAFRVGPRFGVTLDFASTGTHVGFSFYGDVAGMASGDGTFLTPRTSPTVLAQCAGAGARSVPLDITVRTQTPLASG